jgi:hypothetical protein
VNTTFEHEDELLNTESLKRGTGTHSRSRISPRLDLAAISLILFIYVNGTKGQHDGRVLIVVTRIADLLSLLPGDFALGSQGVEQVNNHGLLSRYTYSAGKRPACRKFLI